VSFGREAIALAAALEQHGARFFGNSARPSGMLSIKGVASPDTISKIRSAWQLAHGGTKSGGTAIIASDAKYEQLTMSSVDAQYQELRAFQAWASPSNRVVHG
jgi:phage portal protein BeeE